MDVFVGLALRRGVGLGWLQGRGWVGGFGCSRGCHDSGPGPRLLHLDVGLSVAAAGLVVV